MAAQDAELRLKVSLDLAFFRQQLTGLGQAAAGYKIPVQVQFDRRSVQNELNALGRNISQRTYRLEVATNLAAEIKNAGTLAKALRGLDNAVQKNKGIANRAVAGQGAGTVDASSFSAMLNRATKPALEALYQGMAKAKIPMADIGRGTVNELRASIISGVPAITRDIAQGLANGLDPKLKENGREGAKSFIDAFKSATGIASPSKIFKQLGEFSADGLEIGFLNGLKEFKGKAISEIRKIVALMKLELASVGDIDMAARGGPRINRVFARGSGGYTAPIGPLPHGSVEPWAMGAEGYEPRMVSSVRGMPGGFAAWSRAMTNNPPASPPMTPASQFGGGGFGDWSRAMSAKYAPQQFPATELPKNYFENARKYVAALEVARNTMSKFRVDQLPFIGGLQGIASEFGLATKQVLLYGTAYRGLAFITSLPGQILNAAKSQQQFNNSLKTATQDTGTFAKELLYVDNVQRAFGLNLEVTRAGFTKLYASMAPTGFDSGSIEKLFTGISAATAALQLTPDKAERVIYAFGQMASKGQIMSEELKGQLGDVLPGALAIFAKAAGMSVKEFSEAMEDGEFVGQRFREVFAKVSDELMNRFGTGAQVAGKSLQGLLNTVQGDFQRTLESFAPLANAAAQALLGPIGSALRQLSTSAQIAMGELGRIQGQLSMAQQNVIDVRAGGGSAAQIQAAEQNVAALTARYQALNEALKDPAVAKQVRDLQLFIQELTKAGTFVLNLASGIGNILSPVLNFLGTNLTTVVAAITAFYAGFQAARLAAMALMGTLMLYRGLSALLGFGVATQQATALAGAFNILGIGASSAQIKVIGLRLALTALVATTVIGAVIAGVVAIAGAFATMSDRAKDAAQSSRDAAKAAIDAGRAGNTMGAAMGVQGVLTEARKAAAARKTLEAIYARATPEQRKGVVPMRVTAQESIALQGTALTSGIIQAGVSQGGARQIRVPSRSEMSGYKAQFGSLAGQQAIDLQEAKAAQRQAEETNRRLGLNVPTPSPASAFDAQTKSAKAKGPKPTPFVDKGVDILKNQYEERKKILDTQLAEQKISQYKYDIELSSLQLMRDEAILLKQREISREKIEKSRMTAADKERSRLQAESVYFSGMQKATSAKVSRDAQALAKVSKPITDGIKEEQFAIEKTTQEIQNYRAGIKGLTAAQEAEFIVRQKLADLDPDVLEAKKQEIAAYRALIQSRIENNQLSEREASLQAMRARVSVAGQGLMAGYYGSAAQTYQTALQQPGATPEYARQMAELETRAMQLESVFGGIQNAIGGVGDAFGTMMTQGVASLIQGTATAQEVFSNFLKAVGDALLQAAAQMIATYIAIGIARAFAGLGGGKGGGAEQSVANINAGAAQYGGNLGGPATMADFGGIVGSANGNFLVGGFQAFADGGMVNGPTLGLVGEGGEPEYIIPQSKMRGAMERYGNGARGASVIPAGSDSNAGGDAMAAMMSPIDVRYTVERINSVDYVTADQFQAGLQQAAKQGATQGEQRTLRRLQMSASTRRRVGI